MDYNGNVDGNSIWTFSPTFSFPGGSTIAYYFHAWDDWGGQMWDSNYGANYGFGNPYTLLGWLGNTWHYPTNGVITATNEVHMLTESWPTGAGSHGEIVYSPSGDDNWYSTPLTYDSVIGNNDLWLVNVGAFNAGQTIQYAIKVVDMEGNEHWDNNAGQDYTVQINPDPNDLDWDDDGMPNTWEMTHNLNPSSGIDANSDPDNDGISNFLEYLRGTNPQDTNSKNSQVYADASMVDNQYNGYAPIPNGESGPKRDIQQAINVAISGDTIHFAPGTYVDTQISAGDKTIILKAEGTVVFN